MNHAAFDFMNFSFFMKNLKNYFIIKNFLIGIITYLIIIINFKKITIILATIFNDFYKNFIIIIFIANLNYYSYYYHLILWKRNGFVINCSLIF